MTPDPLTKLLAKMAEASNPTLNPLRYTPDMFTDDAAWLREHRTELLTALGGEQDMTRDDTWLFSEVS